MNLIDKDALVAWAKETYLCENASMIRKVCYKQLLEHLDTLEVKEIETPVIPKHSYFETIYHCGSEPRWKVGDILAVYEFYSDYEGEEVFGKVIDVYKKEEYDDWVYVFEGDDGGALCESVLVSDGAYRKN